jgi:hypothetical protein
MFIDYPDWDDSEGKSDTFDEEELDGECGMSLDGGCELAGTEHCDFECPYRDEP